MADRPSKRSAARGTAHYRLRFFLLVSATTSCDYFLPVTLTQSFNMAPKRDRITKEEALSFLLTYIVVEQEINLVLDQLALFSLTNLALRGVEEINASEGIIPHEVIESLAKEYLDTL